VQYFLAIAPPVEVVRFAERAVQSHRKLDQRSLPPVSVGSHMPYCTSSATAIERSPSVPDNTPTIACLSCGDTMKNLRTIPKLRVRPEKVIFHCPSCKGADTKEVKWVV
jgi:hypothetical protein